jgi:general secretion pathway protein E
MTIEDPVEYRIEGINQTPINPQAGVTFANGLRTILRQDPDIIMVGEIRDIETAEISVQAALTGHLVLSTLHTNDAPSAMTRLLDMGIKPYLIVSSVIGVVAQRLVRTICPDCKKEYTPTREELEELGMPADKKYVFAKGAGCQYCMHTGYKGRTGVFEIMKVTENIRNCVLNRDASSRVKKTAIEEGMRTLKQASVEKVISKITTTDEIKRVIFAEEY